MEVQIVERKNMPLADSKTLYDPPSDRVGVDWSVAGPILVAHLVAFVFAGPTFTWHGLVSFFVMYILTAGSVTSYAHRMVTHKSFETVAPVRWILTVFFHMAGQGSIFRWMRDHVIHHRYSDQEGDPHSPHYGGGFWHAQLWWLWKMPPTQDEDKVLYARYARRLVKDKFARMFGRTIPLLTFHVLVAGAFYLFGAFWEKGFHFNSITTGWFGGVSQVVWGVFVRFVLVLHGTSLINSATHMTGYRTYTTTDESRNSWWIAILTMGEGWHNNHHHKQDAANQGFHKWWEFDPTFVFILGLATVGLAKNIRVYRPKSDETQIWFKRKIKKKRDQEHSLSL